MNGEDKRGAVSISIPPAAGEPCVERVPLGLLSPQWIFLPGTVKNKAAVQ